MATYAPPTGLLHRLRRAEVVAIVEVADITQVTVDEVADQPRRRRWLGTAVAAPTRVLRGELPRRVRITVVGEGDPKDRTRLRPDLKDTEVLALLVRDPTERDRLIPLDGSLFPVRDGEVRLVDPDAKDPYRRDERDDDPDEPGGDPRTLAAALVDPEVLERELAELDEPLDRELVDRLRAGKIDLDLIRSVVAALEQQGERAAEARRANEPEADDRDTPTNEEVPPQELRDASERSGAPLHTDGGLDAGVPEEPS